jgi:hypothetical protein
MKKNRFNFFQDIPDHLDQELVEKLVIGSIFFKIFLTILIRNWLRSWWRMTLFALNALFPEAMPHRQNFGTTRTNMSGLPCSREKRNSKSMERKTW